MGISVQGRIRSRTLTSLHPPNAQSDSDYAPPYSETEGESTDEPEFEESDSDDGEWGVGAGDVNCEVHVTNGSMDQSPTWMELDEPDEVGWFQRMSIDMEDWDAFAEQVSSDRWRTRPSELGASDFYHTWHAGVGGT